MIAAEEFRRLKGEPTGSALVDVMRDSPHRDIDLSVLRAAAPVREAFRQHTLGAWEAYRATGLHVTANEADAWLAQLEQGNDIDPPASHV